MDDPVFSLNDVTYRAGGRELLSKLSFNVNPGEFLAVIGPSGAGKTTLLRLFNGLQSPASGSINYHGRSMEKLDYSVLRSKVGMVFQRPVIIPGTVWDNLTLFKRWIPHWSLRQADLAQVLEQVNLDFSVLDQSADSLSGGEQQRVALARTLLNAPEVLLLDEPTSGMDPGLTRQILALISRLHHRLKLTIILVTHYPHSIRDRADTVLFLDKGRIVDYGRPEILVHPPSSALKTFLKEVD